MHRELYEQQMVAKIHYHQPTILQLVISGAYGHTLLEIKTDMEVKELRVLE